MFWSWSTKSAGRDKKITPKIPIKHECCLIYNSTRGDYKEEIPRVKNEMFWSCVSDSIIENNPAEQEKELGKRGHARSQGLWEAQSQEQAPKTEGRDGGAQPGLRRWACGGKQEVINHNHPSLSTTQVLTRRPFHCSIVLFVKYSVAGGAGVVSVGRMLAWFANSQSHGLGSQNHKKPGGTCSHTQWVPSFWATKHPV